MEDNQVEIETAQVNEVPAGAKVTITNHEPVLSEQGQEVLNDLKHGADELVRPKHSYQMTPQAQATLKALRGH